MLVSPTQGAGALDTPNYEGRAVLMYAAMHGLNSVVDELVAAGAKCKTNKKIFFLHTKKICWSCWSYTWRQQQATSARPRQVAPSARPTNFWHNQPKTVDQMRAKWELTVRENVSSTPNLRRWI